MENKQKLVMNFQFHWKTKIILQVIQIKTLKYVNDYKSIS